MYSVTLTIGIKSLFSDTMNKFVVKSTRKRAENNGTRRETKSRPMLFVKGIKINVNIDELQKVNI